MDADRFDWLVDPDATVARMPRYDRREDSRYALHRAAEISARRGGPQAAMCVEASRTGLVLCARRAPDEGDRVAIRLRLDPRWGDELLSGRVIRTRRIGGSVWRYRVVVELSSPPGRRFESALAQASAA